MNLAKRCGKSVMIKGKSLYLPPLGEVKTFKLAVIQNLKLTGLKLLVWANLWRIFPYFAIALTQANS